MKCHDHGHSRSLTGGSFQLLQLQIQPQDYFADQLVSPGMQLVFISVLILISCHFP
jgi:hypothetical protein